MTDVPAGQGRLAPRLAWRMRSRSSSRPCGTRRLCRRATRRSARSGPRTEVTPVRREPPPGEAGGNGQRRYQAAVRCRTHLERTSYLNDENRPRHVGQRLSITGGLVWVGAMKQSAAPVATSDAVPASHSTHELPARLSTRELPRLIRSMPAACPRLINTEFTANVRLTLAWPPEFWAVTTTLARPQPPWACRRCFRRRAERQTGGRVPLIDHVTTEPPLLVGVRCTRPCFVNAKLVPP